MLKRNILTITLFSATLWFFPGKSFAQNSLAWPEITQQAKPWTRWWWEGSAVDTVNLKWIINEYKNAGLGGMEITSIYGVKGEENKFIDFTLPKWMNMLDYTLKQAERAGLGIDMAQASGWPFGGPWVKNADASKYFDYKIYKLSGGQTLKEPVIYDQKGILRQEGQKIDLAVLKKPITANENLQLLAIDQVRYPETLPAETLMAYSEKGEVLDLSAKVGKNGMLSWKAPAGKWTLVAIFQGLHGKMVERAGPGGEGYAIDHFSLSATNNYLNHFDRAFAGHDLSYLRGFFNDSYEVDDAIGEADWTPDFLSQFKSRRGYDLKGHLPALVGLASADENKRVLTDYRETVSDLLLEHYTMAWHKWAAQKSKLIRNQAHGSPANILDLYAATDIPEAEGDDVLRVKFASSAAHVTGKKLSSSESATWLNEHFLSGLGDVKRKMDMYFLGGINHTFYHGANYTPKDAAWPGWLFYAAVHFTPDNTFWEDFPTLNNYVARVQSFLQLGKPDNDVLVYLPFYDAVAIKGRSQLVHFDGIEHGFKGSSFDSAANQLYKAGYSFDFISDRQVQNTKAENGLIRTADVQYKTIIVPAAEQMPLETLQHLVKLAENGASIVFYQKMPQDVPGFNDLQNRRAQLAKIISGLKFSAKTATVGKGRVMLVTDLNDLKLLNVYAEPMTASGIEFIRRANATGKYYFLVNKSGKNITGWVQLNAEAKSIAVFNPLVGQSGYGAIRHKNGNTEIYLQLKNSESVIVQTFDDEDHAANYQYPEVAGEPVSVKGLWTIDFINGGPSLPAQVKTENLRSWTDFEGQDYKNFSGTARYSVKFGKPKSYSDAWILNLGSVESSAKVYLNGNLLETLIGPDYQLIIATSQLKKQNTLVVEVANLMANRIAYMDKNNRPYRKFYNINMSARLKENRGEDGKFTAKNWTPHASGLIGPVSLTPVKFNKPQ
ncbi:glycoside hydrolase family 2 protein [Pedobacter sp. HMF7647]|uniref:Glycoside hydrolase family 2 protein n=1 Tax=Hufsiella arboris TaxID=2695275 RepID=A0A7K1YE18_9SPHI|nr:glycosyl hydrolase [Hufsiella arboris]MXV52278.1 glycoside hydrolase family 2 protein [Hufsiella arboris]